MTFGLVVNVDWFEPYKYAAYSICVIYIAMFNHPRQLWFRRENTIILHGLVPGPQEPSVTMDQFWRPLLDDFLSLWDGVLMDIPSVGTKSRVHAALMCVACYLPAGRNTCSFLGHSASLGHPCCKKEFPGQVGNNRIR